MRNGVIATGMLALALLGSACGQGGKGTAESQGGGGPIGQPTSMPPPMQTQTQTQVPPESPGESPSESPSVSPSESGSMAPVGPATVDAKQTDKGMILVDGKGRTVYLFDKDKPGGKPTCTGACLKEWPPFLTEGKPVAGSGVKGDWLGTVQWPDGKTQVTYHGHPLYYYAKDTKPGDMKGQDTTSNGGEWYIVSADKGEKVGP